jgi:hypothetical protein
VVVLTLLHTTTALRVFELLRNETGVGVSGYAASQQRRPGHLVGMQRARNRKDAFFQAN